jgi:hypothetical protein
MKCGFANPYTLNEVFYRLDAMRTASVEPFETEIPRIVQALEECWIRIPRWRRTTVFPMPPPSVPPQREHSLWGIGLSIWSPHTALVDEILSR